MLSAEDLNYRAKLWNDVLANIHAFFAARGYTEVRVPLIVRSPGMEPNLNPVGVDVQTLDATYRAGLITSPEYSMKKLLGAGMEKIYTIPQVFRNIEKLGERWSVEFTMMEWYRQGADYRACMQETEELVNGILGGNDTWPRISYVTDFEARFGVHPDQATAEQLMTLCELHHVSPGELAEPLHEKIDRLYCGVVMPEYLQKYPRFFLCEYPVACASLSKKGPNGTHAERFEGYVKGIEICNGFTELVDPIEQRARFAVEAEERRSAGKEVFPVDEELLAGLASIASPTFGNALGIDRIVMLKAGVKEIDAIHLFPPSGRFTM